MASMAHTFATTVTLLVLISSGAQARSLATAPGSGKPSESEVLALFKVWNAALTTLDPSKVADLYTSDAVLLPTLSNKVRSSRAAIIDYFTKFLQGKPTGVLNHYKIRYPGDGVVQNLGVYTFTLDGGRQVQARYSFTYKKVDGKWLIIEHHSSGMPESFVDELLSAFSAWNAALQTRDPEQVADLYAPGAVLVPTLSNVVRNSRALIVDYFVGFLAKNPIGEINVIPGQSPNVRLLAGGLAVNSGIYTFTLTDAKNVTTKVGARFTFVYQKFYTKWMIVEHHSSALPEPVA